MKFIYSENYHADIGLHVFPITKYRSIYEKLIGEHELCRELFIAPQMVGREDLLLVHTAEYLRDLDNCVLTPRTISSELPISRKIVDLFKLACGGTVLAGQEAINDRCAVHLSGGFHHAFADRAEGFCYLNDLAVAAKVLQQQRLVERIAIIDCDLHQGNGTAFIFSGDDSVFTFSIHQRDLYPIKQKGDLDIHLPIHIGDEPYYEHIKDAIPAIFDEFNPEFVLYQAGADPYLDDQLGSLSLSIDGLRRRDMLILESCQKREIPVAVTLGGGYAYNTNDTVKIHTNTCLAALEVFK